MPLLSVMVDVIAMMSLWQMLKPLTVTTYYYMADVIANVADGIASAGWVLLWQMVMPSVRWNNH